MKNLLLSFLAFFAPLPVVHAQTADGYLKGLILCIDDNSFSINDKDQLKGTPRQEFIDTIKSQLEFDKIYYKVKRSCANDPSFIQILGVLDATTDQHPESLHLLILDQTRIKYKSDVILYSYGALYPVTGRNFSFDVDTEANIRDMISKMSAAFRDANP